MQDGPATRDIVVLGASAGGVEVLTELVREFPRDLPAAVFIVLHLGGTSALAEILGRSSALPVAEAVAGDAVERGRVLVAPYDRHLLLHDSHVLVRKGPRENLARPAVDPLFRSAACSFGARVTGVVLTGALNDGTAGLRAIRRCGGATVVQDPDDAAVSAMPQSALDHVGADHCVPAAELSRLLTRLVAEPAAETPEIPLDLRLESAVAAQERPDREIDAHGGQPSRFRCPECRGALWEIMDGDFMRFRCHVGHAFSSEILLAAHEVEGEEMLWGLVRSHQERAALVRRMAQRDLARNRGDSAADWERRALAYEHDAATIQQLIAAEVEVWAGADERRPIEASD